MLASVTLTPHVWWYTGRVEELVRGVKGENCAKVTETINSMLGKVISSEPTEEMYEQNIVQEQTVYDNESTW